MCRVYFSFSPWNTNGTAQGRRPGTNSTEEGRGDEKKKKTTDTSGIKKNRRGGIGRGAKEMDDLSVCATHTHTHTRRRRAKKRKCRRRRVRPDKKEEANRADDDNEIKTNARVYNKRDDDLADARRCLCTESRTTATRLTAGRVPLLSF